MQKKRTSIQRDTFEDNKHEILTIQQTVQNELKSKSVSSKMDDQKIEAEQNANGYRFELVPDHHYSHQAERQQNQFNEELNERYSSKLQGAYILQNAMSRMTATLFISCWESLKNMLSQQVTLYHRLDASPTRQIKQKDILSKQCTENLPNQTQQLLTQVNPQTEASKSLEEIKIEISQRQKRGFTLDSLEKIKQKRSKSKQVKQIQPQRDNYNLKKQPVEPQINKETVKFNLSQHQRNIVPEEQESHFPRVNKYSDENKNDFNKNQTLKINLQNLERDQNGAEDHKSKNIFQSGDYHKLLKDTKLTRHDFSYEQFGSANSSSFPFNPFSVPFSYKDQSNLRQHVNYFIPQNKNVDETKIEIVNQQYEDNFEKQEFQRVKILAQIANKLQFSKLRVQKRQNKNGYDFQIIRKISRLQKAIKDLKSQDTLRKNERNINYQSISSTDKNIVYQKKTQEDFALKKLLHEIEAIRSDINEIKSLSKSKRQQNPSKIIENQNNFIFGRNDSHLRQKQNQNQFLLLEKRTERQISQMNQNKASKFSFKPQPNVNTNNLSLSNKVYRKVHAQENSQIIQLQQRQVREQYVKIMVENVRKIRNQQSKVYLSDLDIARPIRGNYEREWKKLQQQRRQLRDQEDNCCVLMEYY